MSVEFDLKGTEEVLAKLAKLAREAPFVSAQALRIEAEVIMTRSKAEFVPVDLGTLRSSGRVRQSKFRPGGDIEVELSFGGAAAPYALIQHEELRFRHKVGEAKYLEKPVMAAIPGMNDRLAKRIAAGLGV